MTLRALMNSDKPKFGTFLVEFATPGIGYILKNAGCDFVLVDLEHSGFGMDTCKALLRYLEAADLPAIVGMPSKDPLELARVLDMGAPAVVSPMVGSVAEAEDAVARTRYAPVGRRAVSGGVGHDKWRGRPLAETLRAADPLYFAKIETVGGVDAVEGIAGLDGVDGLWIGHGDLTASIGIPGQYEDSRYRAAEDRILAAARAAGKPVGRLVDSVDEGLALLARGLRFIGYSGDAWLLQAGLGDALAALRRGVD